MWSPWFTNISSKYVWIWFRSALLFLWSTTSHGWIPTVHFTTISGNNSKDSWEIWQALRLCASSIPILMSPFPPAAIKFFIYSFQWEKSGSVLRWVCASNKILLCDKNKEHFFSYVYQNSLIFHYDFHTKKEYCSSGGIGIHARFRYVCRKMWGFESLLEQGFLIY